MKKFTLLSAVALITLSMNALASDTSTYSAYKSQRGNTVNIPESRVRTLCGDIDGCKVRIAMYDWNGTKRTASRETLFYYNPSNRVWRASVGDREGRTDNNTTEHIINAWACYFTDGYYTEFYNHGDINRNFAVLSWNQYNATCRVTLID